LESQIIRARGRERGHVAAAAPAVIDVVEKLCKCLRRQISSREGAAEHQRAAPIGVGRGEQCGHRTAFRYAKERRLLHTRCIHHRPKVVDPLVQTGKLDDPTGQSRC
jgi:hypothetical protein